MKILPVFVTTLLTLGSLSACGDDDSSGGGSDASGDANTTQDASGDAKAADANVADANVSEDGSVSDAAGGDAELDAATNLPEAVAVIAPTGETEATTSGLVTFTTDGDVVTITYELENCPDGEHQTHIHEGDGCGSREAQGMHWGPERGEGIPNIVCSGGTGSLTYSRNADDAKTLWTVDDGEDTDIVGHPVVIHGLSSSDRIACGVIQVAPL